MKSNLPFHYDYLSVAVDELKKAIRWRGIAAVGADPKTITAARRIMRSHALRSRKAFNGELLPA